MEEEKYYRVWLLVTEEKDGSIKTRPYATFDKAMLASYRYSKTTKRQMIYQLRFNKTTMFESQSA